MLCFNFLEKKWDATNLWFYALSGTRFIVFLLLSSQTFASDASTDSRVKFSSFQLSPFDCTTGASTTISQSSQQQVSPYIVAEQVRSIVEDCLRISVPLECGYEAVDYIGLGNTVCENDVVTLRGGVMDFSGSDFIPSQSDVAQCLHLALFSTTCLDMIESNFPMVTSLNYEYHTPSPAPVLVTTESNDEVSEPALDDSKSTSNNALSTATMLSIVGGGAVILAFVGFMAAVFQRKRGGADSRIRRQISSCVLNKEDLEDGLLPSNKCDSKPCDEGSAHTPTTLSVKDGSNSSFDEDVVAGTTGCPESPNHHCNSQVVLPSVNDSTRCLSSDNVPDNVTTEMSKNHEASYGSKAEKLQVNNSYCNALAKNHDRKDEGLDSMKSWMGFHLDFLSHQRPISNDAIDDFAPDDVWNPDDNSVSSVDLESLAIAGNGELSFQPSPQRKSHKDRLPVLMDFPTRETSCRRSRSFTDLFPALTTASSPLRLTTSSSMPTFEKWNKNWTTNMNQEYESLNEPRISRSPPRKFVERNKCRSHLHSRDKPDVLENEI